MPERERFQAMMLEHIYGLLDADEIQQLEAYLASPEGAELKAQGDRWKEQIAGAAKSEFPQVTFTAPSATPLATPTPKVKPTDPVPATASTGTTMNTVWTKWAVAASVLLLVGLAIPAGTQFIGWYAQSHETNRLRELAQRTSTEATSLEAEQKAKRDAVTREFNTARDAQETAMKNYQEALVSARKAIEQKDFMVRLVGPSRIQPGAPNEWRIETLNRQGGYALPKKMDVVVKDQANKELLRETHERPQGPASLKLPTAFWEGVKPNSELFLEVVAYNDDNRKSVLAEKVPLARPIYVTHLATDKPLYKPSETLRYRSLTLDRATFLPPEQDMHLKFRLKTPEGAMIQLDDGNSRVMDGVKPVLGPDRKPVRGIGAGEYEIPADAPGGEYALMVNEFNPRTGQEVALETRKFIVNRYVPDVFEKKLEFDAKSYGANDFVQARVEASRTAGGALKGARLNVTVNMDGAEIFSDKTAKLDDKGIHNIRFKLPNKVGNGNVTLSVNVADGSDSEVILRPVPVVGSKLKLEFYPEGGDIVAGVPSRVYFQVRTPLGKPADLKGTIVDNDGKDVVEVSTLTDAEKEGVNRGQGVFILTPKAGATYFLKVKTPTGIEPDAKEGFALPDVKADGVVLTALDAVTDQGESIRVRVQVGQGDKVLHVGGYARGRLIDHKRVDVSAGKPVEVRLQGDAKLGGVTRVTVFEEPKAAGEGRANLVPRAERLVYRKPAEQLMFNITPDKARYTPAGQVNLELAAFNEKETPAPAIIMVGVVNQSVIRMADNKTDRLMPTHFLLAGDVKSPAELEHADFLMTDHPKAALALDLLLGTQGWRRFAEQNIVPANAQPVERQEVERMLVAHGQRTTAPMELYRLEEQRVNAEFLPKMEQSAIRFTEAEIAHAEFHQTEWPQMQQRVQAARTMAAGTKEQYESSAAELYNFEVQNRTIRGMAMPIFLIGLFLFAAGSMVMVALRRRGQRTPYVAAMAGSIAMAALVLGGVVLTLGTSEHARYYSSRYNNHGMFMAKSGAKATAAMEMDMAREEKAAFPAGEGPVIGAFDDAGAMQPQAGGMGGGRGGAKGGFQPPRAPAPAPVAPPRMDPRAVMELKEAQKADGKADKDVRKAEEAMKNRLLGGDGEAKKKVADQTKQQVARDAARFRRAQAEMFNKGEARGALAPGMPPPPGGFGQGGFAGKPGGDRMMEAEMLPQAMPFIVREYAHHRDPSLNDVRSDFTETVYWHPVLVMPDNGKMNVRFQLSDDIARYQVLVAGHTVDGRVGAVTKTIEARKPFTVDPKVPLEVNSNDIIDVPVRIMNDSDDRRLVSFIIKPSQLAVEGGLIPMENGLTKDNLDLMKNQGGRKIFRVRPKVMQGEALLVVEGQSEPAAAPDSAARVINVVPEGFPGVGQISDMLEKKANSSITLPKDLVKGTLKVRLEVYPTSMADLVKGLEGLIREPYGCFEQTSTSNYPNTLILDYMNQTNQANPEVSKRAKDMLDRGYGRLISYECPDTPLKLKQGFEWFGGTDMAHEALTAYGLLQFKDMAKVHKVDPEMIKRTQAFLISRKDGQGGFKRNSRALDSFGGAPKHTTDAYIVWALVESDPDDTEKMDLKKEIEALKTQAFKADSREAKDSYFVALVANILLQRGEREKGMELLDRLKDKNFKDGFVNGGETSITRSGGRDLDIEVTATAMLGWMRANDNTKYAGTVKEATKWLSQQRGGYGGFGSTQSTIMALKALITYAKKSAHPSESGEIVLTVDGKRVAAKKFTEQDVEVIGLDIEKADEIFKAGVPAEVSIETDAKHPYPFTLSCRYTTLTPMSAEKCAVQISTKLAKNTATEGDTVPLNVTLENKLKTDHGMAVAIVGLPAGMKVPTDMKQLVDLREKGVISYFETRGRELVLYWRGLGPTQKIDLSIDLICDVPGEYRGPASRGYLYYNADHKHWVEPLSITIKPAAAKDEVTAK